MEKELKNLEDQALKELEKVQSLAELEPIETKYLGRKEGLLTAIMKSLKALPSDQKPIIGPLANKTKTTIEDAFSHKRNEIESAEIARQLSKEFFDTTIPSKTKEIGHVHPLSQVQEEVERIFSQMGFSIMDGPEVESEYYNFEGLNIPKDHPARDMQDTFFIQEKNDSDYGRMVLRTHTSPVQVRTMEKYGAPLRVIVPGRTFRYEATDASHDTTFYQVEGLLIDKDISLAHLKGIMKEFLSRLFGKEVTVRF
ncbi:MAG: phenylalanine--tRNA ligase subunit alpha, partial [Candidatus Gracilibacteria bacterium]|nr:phenylalanine--tRNA ligase subunit alpha [Candidatus Gracilibacteria bacterium]